MLLISKNQKILKEIKQNSPKIQNSLISMHKNYTSKYISNYNNFILKINLLK